MIRHAHQAVAQWVRAGTWVLVCTLGAGLGAAPCFADGHEVVSEREIQSTARRLGVALVTREPGLPVRTHHGSITGVEARAADVASYRPILKRVLARYPKAFWKKTKVRRLVLCRNLAFGGQRRTAVPDFEHDALYLDVDWQVPYGQTNPAAYGAYLKRVFHHDLFHIIDLRDDGKLYSDPAWARLNPPTFKYGTGGKDVQDDRTVGELSTSHPGFLNAYARSGIEEDKAETFTYLMTGSEALLKRMKDDAVLSAKVAFMLNLIHAFEPKLVEGISEAHRLLAARLPFASVAADQLEALLETAASRRRPLLVFAYFSTGVGGERGEELYASLALRNGLLADLDVRVAALGCRLYEINVSGEEAGALMKRFGIRRAPALLLVPRGSSKPRVLKGRTTKAKLLKALARLDD